MALSRKKKAWLILTGSLLLIFIILVLIANRIVSNIADEQARKFIDGLENDEYTIDFEKVRVNLFSGAINVYDLEVIPNSLAMEKVKRSRLAKPLLQLRIPRIRVGEVPFMGIVRGNDPEIGSIFIHDAEVIVHAPVSLFSEGRENPEGHDDLFSGNLGESIKEAGLRKLTLELALFRYIDESCAKVELESMGTELKVDEIRIISGNPDALEVSDIQLQTEFYQMDLPGGFYSISAGPFSASYSEQQISIDSFRLIPAYTQDEFGRKFGKQTDRFDILAGSITVEGIVFDSLLKKHLIAETIEISNTEADIYRDKRVPRDMNIFPKLPQTAIAELKIPVYIQEVHLLNAGIRYQEMVAWAPRPGQVYFENTDLLIGGICNYPDSIQKGQVIHAQGHTMIMGKAAGTFYFYLPVGNHKEYFTYHGQVSSFTANLLDPMISPLANMQAKEGNVNGINFYAMAMSDTAVGRVEMLYNDLRLDVNKKKRDDADKLEENKFISFIARTILHKENPRPGKEPRIGLMYFVRDPNKGFFNFIWKNLQHGLLASIAPLPKHHAKDMSWSAFKAQWRKTLLLDYEQKQQENK